MWNSGGEPDRDLSKQVSNMSAALQLRPDCLQQFMSGNLSLEALAAMQPSANTTNSAASGDVPGPSQMWGSLFPTHSYESSTFANILSGASQGAMLHQPTVTTPTTTYGDSPFRSPPFTADSSSLMELSTVTPSRIKSSPAAIINKADMSDVPGTSKSVSSEPIVPQLHLEYAPSSPNTLSEDQFKIVIRTKPSSNSSAADNYTINLDDLPDNSSTPADESNQSEETEMFQTSAAQSDSEENCDDLDGVSQNELDAGERVVRKGGKKKKGLTKIPRVLRGLMGEANLAYARGAHEDAIKMCMEVVRQAPYAAEPYDTLAIIYEEKGESGRSLQYSLLAAHLSRTDASKWIALAGMCLNQGEVEKAIDCYTRAAKAKPRDYKLQIEVGKLCMKQLNFQKAMYFYKTAVMLMPHEEGKEAVDLARELAKMCHNAKQNLNGIVILEQAFESHPTRVTDEDANLLCELYLMEKQYDGIFKLLARHSEMNIVFEDYDNPDYNTITKLEPPENMAVDLLCKVAIAAIQLERSDLVEDIVKTICSHNPSDTGDIQFEVAEAYIGAGKHAEALNILNSLVTSRDYSLAAVWMRHGECCRALNNLDSAMVSYKNCVRLAPGHVQAHLLYSKMLRKAEKFSQAAQTLDAVENYEIEPEDYVRIYYERYKVCKTWAEKGRKKKMMIAVAADAALLIFANRFKNSAFRDGRVFVVRRKKPSSNPTAGELKLIQIRHLQLPDQKNLAESDLYLKTTVDIFHTKEKWMKFFDDVVALLHRCRRFKDAIYLADGVLFDTRWFEHLPTRRHFEHVTFVSCILAKQYQRAYGLISVWLRNELDNAALWNYFAQLVVKTEDQRHQKFCLRLLVKNTHCLPLIVMAAHNWMASGYYKTALGEYMHAHKRVPTEPLYVMMIAIAFVHLSSQKFTDFKHSFLTQALAYFHKYFQLRKLNQESYYNIGRGMHQVGLEHFAIHYYERALESDPPLVNGYETDDRFSLRREIAFNLSLIYRKSHNHSAANQLLGKYCVI